MEELAKIEQEDAEREAKKAGKPVESRQEADMGAALDIMKVANEELQRMGPEPEEGSEASQERLEKLMEKMASLRSMGPTKDAGGVAHEQRRERAAEAAMELAGMFDEGESDEEF